ncbi:sulfurtransferase complex subunit TusB [Salinivibrio sp. ES.052]|uniref:sulfurtransferase complex subunit TusB n=1 Tax=Salinivibrio sp. ES.052 TaxID=1882823 RepID=UPI0009291069|nr:sulfurtransferase complex subunit TusB [Salinivibrio sp. ES.052]SIO17397.1 tRNA 2-thiouridine synthesizing protein B [Salinivibrio sp. ES.052]
MLHLVKTSPYSHQALWQCLHYADQNSVVVLISDAVLAGVAGSEWASQLVTESRSVYVLRNDARARGLHKRIDSAIEMIDMDKLVALSVEHTTQMTW